MKGRTNQQRRLVGRPNESVRSNALLLLPQMLVHSPHTPTGFPVLLKASAGGGGKGMRVVRDISQLADSIDSGSPFFVCFL